MNELGKKHPGYGFEQHKGYSTPEHLAAIDELGVLDFHRRSYAPIRRALGLDPEQQDLFAEAPAASDAGAEGRHDRVATL